MDWLLVLLLAVVQGIGEFLPISSSGHLAIAAWLCGEAGHPLPDVLGLSIVLHGGTLLSILVVYWRRIVRLVERERRAVGLVIVGTLPAVVVGLALKKVFPVDLTSALLSACMLPITGTLLLRSKHWPVGQTELAELSYGRALTIGAAQALAILPGLSRSGFTIMAGLGVGLSRESAATFSFLLAIPAIAGACVLEAADLAQSSEPGLGWPILLTGAAVSFGVGLVALRWLLVWLERGRLYQFGLWCLAVGGAVLAYHGWQAWG